MIVKLEGVRNSGQEFLLKIKKQKQKQERKKQTNKTIFLFLTLALSFLKLLFSLSQSSIFNKGDILFDFPLFSINSKMHHHTLSVALYLCLSSADIMTDLDS